MNDDTATVQQDETPQQRFDRLYITSSEICRLLNVSRTAVLQARRRGLLPGAVCVKEGALYVWERAHVRSNLQAWQLILKTRRDFASTTSNTAAG